MSNFYIVATPIGNLKDITLRALEVLQVADIVLCEDTRTTRKLLSAHGISVRTTSFHKFSSDKEIEAIVSLFDQYQHIALVSDAGTPAISDPGSLLVQIVRERRPDVVVQAIPGPSALAAAVSISGWPMAQFTFVGFLPHKKGRQKKLDEALAYEHSIVLYESTHRICKLLNEIHARQPEREVCICKELTKMHEQVLIGTAQELLSRLEADPSLQKGEFVLICR